MFLHQCGRRSPPGIQKALRTTTQKYAAAHNRRVSLGVVLYSDSPSRSHRYRTRLIAALGPPSVSPKPQVAGGRCGRRFRFSSGATIGGVDTTSRGNSKSLANLLCAYAVPDDEPARIVRPRFQIPGPWTKFYYLNWPRKAWLLTPHVIAQI